MGVHARCALLPCRAPRDTPRIPRCVATARSCPTARRRYEGPHSPPASAGSCRRTRRRPGRPPSASPCLCLRLRLRVAARRLPGGCRDEDTRTREQGHVQNLRQRGPACRRPLGDTFEAPVPPTEYLRGALIRALMRRSRDWVLAVTSQLTTWIADHSVYAVFALMAIDARAARRRRAGHALRRRGRRRRDRRRGRDHPRRPRRPPAPRATSCSPSPARSAPWPAPSSAGRSGRAAAGPSSSATGAGCTWARAGSPAPRTGSRATAGERSSSGASRRSCAPSSRFPPACWESRSASTSR